MSVTKAGLMVTIGENGLTSTGLQYINTEINFDGNNKSVIIDCKWDEIEAISGMWGIETANADRVNLFMQGDVAVGFGNQRRSVIPGSNIQNALERHKYKIVSVEQGVEVFLDDVFISSAIYNSEIDLTANAYLFAVNRSAKIPSKATIYSFQARDNDVLVRDLVPVPQGSVEFKSKRNLFSGLEQGGFSGGNPWPTPNVVRSIEYIEIRDDIQYTLQAVGPQRLHLWYYADDKSFIGVITESNMGGTGITRTFTPISGAVFLRIDFEFIPLGPITPSDVSQIQLEIGSVATQYEPFVDSAPSNCMWCRVSKTYFENQGTGSFGFEYKQFKTINKLFTTIEKSQYALASTGGQYIDTEYTPTSEKLSIEARFKRSPIISNEDVCLCGSQTTGNFSIIPYWEHADNVVIFAGSTMRALSIITAADTWYDLEVETDNGSLTRNLSGAVSSTTYTGTLFKGTSMYLFAANATGVSTYNDLYNFSGAIQYFRIWDNGVLVRDFKAVPQGDVTYSSTPAPSNCMWDAVTEKYYVNKGNGEFGIEGESGKEYKRIKRAFVTMDGEYKLVFEDTE